MPQEQAYQSGLGSLFGGISQGFFDYGREEEKRARDIEDRTRNESLKVLTGLLDQSTPETRGVLLRQMGDLMGIKGKQRTVWDRLTGRGLDDTTDQIQTRFQNILSNVVPAEEFEKLKRVPIEGALPTPTAGAGPLGYQTYEQPYRDESAGKIALRDPQREGLEKLRAQYELKSEADRAKFQESETQRQAGRLELARLNEEGRVNRQRQATLDLAERATLARARNMPGGLNNPDNITRAMMAEARNYDLKQEELEARIGYLGSKGKEAEANARALGSTEFPGSKPLEIEKFKEGTATRYDPIFKNYNSVRAKSAALQSQIADAERRIQKVMGEDPKYSYDPSTGQLIDRKTGKVDPIGTQIVAGMGGVSDLLKQLPDLKKQLVDAQSEEKGIYGQLGNAPELFEDRNGVMVPRPAVPVGTARVGANTTGQTLPLNPNANKFYGKVGEETTVEDAQPRKPGDTFTAADGSIWQYIRPAPGGRGMDKRWVMKRIK